MKAWTVSVLFPASTIPCTVRKWMHWLLAITQKHFTYIFLLSPNNTSLGYVLSLADGETKVLGKYFSSHTPETDVNPDLSRFFTLLLLATALHCISWPKITVFSFASEYALFTLMEDKIPKGRGAFLTFFFFLLFTCCLVSCLAQSRRLILFCTLPDWDWKNSFLCVLVPGGISVFLQMELLIVPL